MVEKHPLTADYEKLTYTPEMLQKEWQDIAGSFLLLIEGGWANNSVLGLIEYIEERDYAKKFFPGSSLGRLLISKPKNGKLNYQQTLTVSLDRDTNKLQLSYSDWDTVGKEEDWQKAILWTCECGEQELLEKFEEFIKWNQEWK